MTHSTDEEEVITEELDYEVEEETAEEETEDISVEEVEDGFEFDEDGNIVIPDDEEEDADDSEGDEPEWGEPGEEEHKDPQEEAEPDDKPTAPDDRDAEIAELRRQLEELKSVGKDTLTKLGVEDAEDVLMGLAELAADTEGITKEEYLSKKREADKEAQQRELARVAAFERMAREDLAALQAAYPETLSFKTIRDMPKDILAKFGRYRDMGLPPKEAYAAANPDGIRTTVATAARQKSLRESKSHLTSAVPKGSKDTSIKMSKAELAEWRDTFPGKSDKEIFALYRATET